jgi:UDP-N-acetylmuramoylalanine--D-glutamate ligase
VGAARFLAGRGARVTISDLADAEALADSLAQLEKLPLAGIKLGEHDPLDFQTAEFVVVNPAVRPEHPCLQLARANGAVLTSEIELLLNHCPGKVIGVTGSNGKSTTATMLAEILKLAGHRTWLGGNIGGSLLGDLPHMSSEDWVVLELSSFQLAHLGESARRCEIAVITNCSPNHLDWHGSHAAYVAAKQRVLTGKVASPVVVLNGCDPQIASWAAPADGGVLESWPLERVPQLSVPGDHNRQNAACAGAAAEVAGIATKMICDALKNFRGLDHRLQLVAEIFGRRFYNDSKSTTPEATMAALAALDGRIWLLAGGISKGADFGKVAAAIVRRTHGAGLFGTAREALDASIRAHDAGFDTIVTEPLADALRWCWLRSEPGDSILLSPACASHDQFRDFAERGEIFVELVRAIVRSPGAIVAARR